MIKTRVFFTAANWLFRHELKMFDAYYICNYVIIFKWRQRSMSRDYIYIIQLFLTFDHYAKESSKNIYIQISTMNL
jgi:hypothetical protein